MQIGYHMKLLLIAIADFMKPFFKLIENLCESFFDDEEK